MLSVFEEVVMNITAKEQQRSKLSRLGLSVLPAAGLTIGLFVAMNALIEPGEIILGKSEFRPLANIVPEKERPTVLPSERKPVDKIDVVPPPKLETVTVRDVGDVYIAPLEINAPATGIPEGVLDSVSFVGRYEVRETAIPIRNPTPVYPDRALRRGLEGECDVFFSIDAAGRPSRIEASCTDEIFARPSVRAVEQTLFAAKTVNGMRVGQDNLVYPIQYKLSD